MEQEVRGEKRKISSLEEKETDVEFAYASNSDTIDDSGDRKAKLLKCATDVSEGEISFTYTAQNQITRYSQLKFSFLYPNVTDADYYNPLVELFSEFRTKGFNFLPFQQRCILMIAKKPHRYLYVENQGSKRPVVSISPRKGPDATLVDLPVGTGKTLISAVGALSYVLLNQKVLQDRTKYRIQTFVS